MFVHWYPNAVPGYGFGWYAKHMHEPDHPVGEYHQKHYGIATPPDRERNGDTAGGDSRSYDIGSAEDTGTDSDANAPPVFEYKDFVCETQKALDPSAEGNFAVENWDPSKWVEVARHVDAARAWTDRARHLASTPKTKNRGSDPRT